MVKKLRIPLAVLAFYGRLAWRGPCEVGCNCQWVITVNNCTLKVSRSTTLLSVSMSVCIFVMLLHNAGQGTGMARTQNTEMDGYTQQSNGQCRLSMLTVLITREVQESKSTYKCQFVCIYVHMYTYQNIMGLHFQRTVRFAVSAVWYPSMNDIQSTNI